MREQAAHIWEKCVPIRKGCIRKHRDKKKKIALVIKNDKSSDGSWNTECAEKWPWGGCISRQGTPQ